MLLCAAGALQSCAPAPEEAKFRDWLVPHLQAEYHQLPPYAERKQIKYAYSLVDLNGDGANEALVYVDAGMVCGTGGCGLDVFARHGPAWHRVASMTIGYAPIQVLPTKTNGWHDLGIYSRFSATEGNQARLRFDGATYPRNPSVPPAEPMPAASENIVIKGATTPLF